MGDRTSICHSRVEGIGIIANTHLRLASRYNFNALFSPTGKRSFEEFYALKERELTPGLEYAAEVLESAFKYAFPKALDAVIEEIEKSGEPLVNLITDKPVDGKEDMKFQLALDFRRIYGFDGGSLDDLTLPKGYFIDQMSREMKLLEAVADHIAVLNTAFKAFEGNLEYSKEAREKIDNLFNKMTGEYLAVILHATTKYNAIFNMAEHFDRILDRLREKEEDDLSFQNVLNNAFPGERHLDVYLSHFIEYQDRQDLDFAYLLSFLKELNHNHILLGKHKTGNYTEETLRGDFFETAGMPAVDMYAPLRPLDLDTLIHQQAVKYLKEFANNEANKLYTPAESAGGGS